MNKNVTYKNLNEFIKIKFPSIYQSKKYSNETSLDSIIKKNSDEFKLKINNILKDTKSPNGT